MTTTIDVLPDDLLLEIFFIAREDRYALDSQIEISQVCKRWRSLALANPLLWNKIHLESSGARERSYFSVKTTPIFSQRSAPLLLDVVIKDELGSVPFAEILEPYASRIRSLDMTHMRVQFREFKSLLERIGQGASNLRSIQLPLQHRGDWEVEEELPSETPSIVPMKLESLVLSEEFCLECLPFPLGSITQLELRRFSPTRSRLAFIFRNMPALSTLVIEVDHDAQPSRHHFYHHKIDIELETSSLIPSSSLQKQALHFGAESWLECRCGLEFLDVRNLKFLELQQRSIWGQSNPSQADLLSIFKAWKDRLLSLKHLFLSSLDVLDFTSGSGQKVTRSSLPGGIDVAIQTAPTFETHQGILSSFTEIASLTYYLPPIELRMQYDGVSADVKGRLGSVFFPITFIPTPRWRISLGERSFQSHPLLAMEESPSCESVDFIRHVVEIAKGGEIPVRFIDSPSYSPGLLSRGQYDTDDWNSWGNEAFDLAWGRVPVEGLGRDSDSYGELDDGDLSDFDVSGGGYGSWSEDYEPEEDGFEDDGQGEHDFW